MGFSSPNNFLDIFSVITKECGSFKAVEASPFSIGKLNIVKKEGSAQVPVAFKCFITISEKYRPGSN